MQGAIRVKNIRLWVSLRRVKDIEGMCSNLPDDKHILMWDFDEVPLEDVKAALILVQLKYHLPPISILESKAGTNYMAYCFAAKPWREAVKIVVDTAQIDWNYLRLSVVRGYFTLRISEKRGVVPRLIGVLPTEVKPEAAIKDLQKSMRYETSKR